MPITVCRVTALARIPNDGQPSFQGPNELAKPRVDMIVLLAIPPMLRRDYQKSDVACCVFSYRTLEVVDLQPPKIVCTITYSASVQFSSLVK